MTMKHIEATERHSLRAGSLTELGAEVDAFIRAVEAPYVVSGIDIDADINHIRQGWQIIRTSLSYSAVVTTTRGDLTV